MRLLKIFLDSEEGATAIEYGLIAALIAISLIAGFGLFAGNLSTMFNAISTKLTV